MIKQNDPRRWQERADARMVRENQSEIANLSRTPVNREIPHHDIPFNPSAGVRTPLDQDLVIAFFDGVKGKR